MRPQQQQQLPPQQQQLPPQQQQLPPQQQQQHHDRQKKVKVKWLWHSVQTSGQSYKVSTSVNYDSRAVIISNLLVITILES